MIKIHDHRKNCPLAPPPRALSMPGDDVFIIILPTGSGESLMCFSVLFCILDQLVYCQGVVTVGPPFMHGYNS